MHDATGSRGYADHLRSPDDFMVEEVIDPRFSRKFRLRGGKVERLEGRHVLCLLEKRDRTTEGVLRELSQKLGIPLKQIGYAGLKDRHALTTQYVTIAGADKEALEAVRLEGARLKIVQLTDRQLSRGNLIGNRFRIRLHGVRNKPLLEARLRLIGEKGFLNFFGPQRFGVHGRNQEIGLLLLKGRVDEAEQLQGKSIGKESGRFFVHAYQSWLFNLALAEQEVRVAAKVVRIMGADTTGPGDEIEQAMASRAAQDGITQRDFSISRLRLRCRGAERQTIARCSSLRWAAGEPFVIEVVLPKGSYATTLLQQALTSTNSRDAVE